MSHVALLGDSIFDNASYVPGGPAVIDHLRRVLPSPWRATLLARDGAVAADVLSQMEGLPADATHLVVSAGGNDALGHAATILYDTAAASYDEALSWLAGARDEFRRDYRAMLTRLAAAGKPTAVCTVYDSIPGLERSLSAGLCAYNDVITREAVRAGLPVLDLRIVCGESSDYSSLSRIEPSVAGGGKIARAIARLLTDADATRATSRVYT